MKLKKIKPMFTTIVTTMDCYTEDIKGNDGLIDISKKEGQLKELQTVIAVGSAIRDIKEGDLVCVNPSRFAKRQYEDGSLKNGIIKQNPVIKYEFNTIKLGDRDCLLIDQRDIDFIVEDYSDDTVEVVN